MLHLLSLASQFLDNLRQGFRINATLDHRDADRQCATVKFAVEDSRDLVEDVHGLLRRGVFVGHDDARCVGVRCKREVKVMLGWLGKWRWGWRRWWGRRGWWTR